MDTTQTSLYFVLAIVFPLAEIIFSSLIISVITLLFNFQKLHKSKAEEEIPWLENERRVITANIQDELGALLLTAKLRHNGVEVLSKNNERFLNRKHHLNYKIIKNEASLQIT